MDINFVEVVLPCVVVFTAGPHIALPIHQRCVKQRYLLEYVAFHVEVDERPHSDIELPLLEKHWLFNVLLDHKTEASQFLYLLLLITRDYLCSCCSSCCLWSNLCDLFNLVFFFCLLWCLLVSCLLCNLSIAEAKPRDVIVLHQNLL